MSRPDLSFLLPAEPAPLPQPPRPPGGKDDGVQPGSERRAKNRPRGRLAALIAQLRSSQGELEAQNTMLRYSQQAAESASERFEALFASVPLALMVLDEHDMVVQANAVAHRAFQPAEPDRPLTQLMPFVSAQDAVRVRTAFDEARAQGRSRSAEVVFHIGADARITGDLHVAFIEVQRDGDTPLAQFLCAVIDQGPLIAEREQLREKNAQLLASEERFAAVIDSALDAIVGLDAERCITVFNPAAAALFQCAADDALGSPLERFLPDAARIWGLADLVTQAVVGEMRAQGAGGALLAVEVSVAFEHLAEGRSTTVFVRDLTRHQQAEARKRELEAQLRESHKMQAVGTMAGGIAHDFNNILHAILGNVALAQADAQALQASPALRESLAEIDKAGRRARDLVRQILAFGRNESAQRSAVQLAEVVRETVQLLRVTLPPAIDLQLFLPEGLPAVLADATQAGQALLNLCTNAVHAIGDARGRITVHAERLRPGASLAARLALAAGEYVALSVHDSGAGIDGQTLARIFEPFFTTKPVGQGTGLGLAVVHGVMRTHGGAIDVQSRPGEGSCFTLYFPLAGEGHAKAGVQPAAGAAPPPAAPMHSPARPRHVIYVDDDEALVFLVQRLLTRRGYEVSVFTDPHAATAALAAAPARYDLLVTDYNMPGFSGVELLTAVRAIRADLPVALASGYVTGEIEQAARAAGARALIHKPDDVEALCATVERLIHGAP